MTPIWRKFQLKCPRCGKTRLVRLVDECPIQKFDLKCCRKQEVTVTLLKRNPDHMIHSVEWEVKD